MKIKQTAFISFSILAALILLSAVFLPTIQSASARQSVAFSQTKDSKLTAQEMTGVYEFDKNHSNIGFRIKHMGLAEVPGSFTDYTGTINYDATDVTKSSVQFAAKVTSINTGVEPRDKHLRTADFFEVEKFPEMTFKSKRIEKKSDNQFVAYGDFTLKGVTKEISLPFTINNFLKDQRGGIKIGVSAVTTINRQDYGITWGKTLDNGILALDNNVQVNLQIEAAKQVKTETATK
jgi:polyisoprenoid-binding protein YceI